MAGNATGSVAVRIYLFPYSLFVRGLVLWSIAASEGGARGFSAHVREKTGSGSGGWGWARRIEERAFHVHREARRAKWTAGGGRGSARAWPGSGQAWGGAECRRCGIKYGLTSILGKGSCARVARFQEARSLNSLMFTPLFLFTEPPLTSRAALSGSAFAKDMMGVMDYHIATVGQNFVTSIVGAATSITVVCPLSPLSLLFSFCWLVLRCSCRRLFLRLVPFTPPLLVSPASPPLVHHYSNLSALFLRSPHSVQRRHSM